MVDQVLFQLANGLVWGLIVALVALGLSLIYGILNVINLAHASFYMIGAVITVVIAQRLENFWLALIVAPVVVGAISLLVEQLVLKKILDDFNLSVLATLGVLLILQDTVLATYGGDLQRVRAPISGSINISGFNYPFYRALVAVAAILLIGAVWGLLFYTRLGTWVRAVRQDRVMAAAVGIPVPWVFAFTVALGGALAGLAGVLAAPIVVVEYQMGFKILATAFVIVVVGGFGSLPGSILAAVLIGCIEGLFSSFMPATEAKMLMLALMCLFVLWRPDGLLRRRSETVI